MESSLVDLCLNYLLHHIHLCRYTILPNDVMIKVLQTFVDHRKLTDETLAMIVSPCTTTISISKVWLSLTDQSMKVLTRQCPLLETLSLQQCPKLTDDGLEILFKGCTKISSLTLECCWQIGDRGLTAAFQHLKHLRTCIVNNNSLITGIPWKYACVLQSLKIVACGNMTVQSGFESLLQYPCTTLKRLSLPGIATGEPAADHCLITYLSKGCPNLEELYFWKLSKLPVSCTNISKFKNLTALNLRPYVDKLHTFRILSAVFEKCLHLEAIAATVEISDNDLDLRLKCLRNMLKHPPKHLKVLALIHGGYFTEANAELDNLFLQVLAACLTQSKNTLNGLAIDLGGYHVKSTLAPMSVLKAMRELPHLSMLMIAYPTGIPVQEYVRDSAESLRWVSARCGYKEQLTDEDVQYLTSNCPNLEICYDGFHDKPPWITLSHQLSLGDSKLITLAGARMTLEDFGYGIVSH